jgi:hypothetical protein
MQNQNDVCPPSFPRRLLSLRYFIGLFIVGAAVLLLSNRRSAQSAGTSTVAVNTTPLLVRIEPATGDYSIEDSARGWRFTGSVHQRVSPPLTTNGADAIGQFSSTRFEWDDKGAIIAEIRAYQDSPAVMFRITCKSARPSAPPAFPSLTTPANLHQFGFANTVFAPRSFNGGGGASPWLLFDDSAKAVILSPAANFMTAEINRDPKNNLNGGLNPRLSSLPEGFTHQTLMVCDDSIHQAWDRWGHDLTALAGKARPANDQANELRQFGYWTDNGAYYYYKFDPAVGYAGTLLSVADAYRKLGIPLGYMQLDSWWYFKSTTGANGKQGAAVKNAKLPKASWNCYGGLMDYTAHPDVLPDGLAGFQKKLGMPLITHNRWIDINSPYRQKYKISGVAAIDPKWWDDITEYLKSSGVEVYEQDWLNEIYINSPEFASTTTAGEAFMDNMARATKARGMRMQYCMELPCHYLQGSKYDNLTSVRVSQDRFERGKWDSALYASQMATSLGEWPWVDTFNSSETPNMILATLTAGPVGVSDAIDKIDVKNISTCCRPDGVIVKPDTSIVPLDRTYLSDSGDRKSPMIAAAYTDHGPYRTAYVFCYPRSAEQSAAFTFDPVELGINAERVWIYQPATGKAELQLRSANKSFVGTFAEPAFKKAWSYYIVAPESRCGIALIGDINMIASAGKQRLTALEGAPDHITATLTFAVGEKAITLHGFAKTKPLVTADTGAVGTVNFDPATSHFTVDISPSPEHAAIVRLAAP